MGKLMRLKTAFSIMLAIMVLLVSMPVTNAKLDIDLQLGDANCDGKVNTGDSIVILQYSIGLRKLGFYGELAADVNGDDKINSGDAMLILRYLIGVSEFAAEPLNIISTNENYNKIEYKPASLGDLIEIDLSEYTSYTVTNPFGTTCYAVGFSVNLIAGKWAVFETTFKNMPVDTILFLMDSKYNMFAANDDGGDDAFSRLEFFVYESGVYNLLVCSADISTVGSCYLQLVTGNMATPTEAPTETPAPSETPVPTPTPTPTPIPTNPPTGNVELENYTLPSDDKILQYGKPYDIAGDICAVAPITKVRIDVYNYFNELEIFAEKEFSADDNVLLYTLNNGEADCLNNLLAFGTLSYGKKTLVLNVTTDGNPEETLFMGSFFMGATDSVLAGNAYNSGTSQLGAEQRQAILNYLNSLNESEIGSHAVMNAFTLLGTPYGTGVGQLDCSAAMQKAYSPLGVKLPRTSEKQGEFCLNLNGMLAKEVLIPGDLIFFTDNYCSCGRFMEIHHVAMFVGTINGTRYYIESSYNVGKVVLRMAWGESGTGRWSIAFYGRPYIYVCGTSSSIAYETVS